MPKVYGVWRMGSESMGINEFDNRKSTHMLIFPSA